MSDDPARLIEAYYAAGWTDGLPVVPPTEKSIAEMLAGAGLRPEEIIGEIPGRNTVVVAHDGSRLSIASSAPARTRATRWFPK